MGLVYLKDELKMMLTGSTTPSLPHPLAVFDALSSLCSWSLELALAEATRKKNVRISPNFSFYYLAFRGNKFQRLKDFVVFKICVWMHEINSLGSISDCVRTYIALSDANRRPYRSTKGTGQDSYNPHWINSNWSAYIRESKMKKSKQWLNRGHNLLNT